MTKLSKTASSLLLTSVLLGTLATASGCKFQSKKEREEQQAEAVRSRTISDEEAKAETAKKDLADRITTFEAIAGSYEGYYSGLEKKQFVVKLTLTVNNLPPVARANRPLKEGDILAQIDALSLDATIEEFWDAGPGKALERAIACNVSNVKPDLASGLLRFNCNAGSVGGTRYYIVGLDNDDDTFETTFDTTSIEQRNRRTSDDLTLKRISRISAMTLKIQATYVDFYGKMRRKMPKGY